MKIYRKPVPIDMAGVLCSGMLRQRTPLGDSFLEIAGSDGIRPYTPMFLSNRLDSKGALQSSTSYYHHVARFLVQ
jgi:hypothetical protein